MWARVRVFGVRARQRRVRPCARVGPLRFGGKEEQDTVRTFLLFVLLVSNSKKLQNSSSLQVHCAAQQPYRLFLTMYAWRRDPIS